MNHGDAIPDYLRLVMEEMRNNIQQVPLELFPDTRRLWDQVSRIEEDSLTRGDLVSLAGYARSSAAHIEQACKADTALATIAFARESLLPWVYSAGKEFADRHDRLLDASIKKTPLLQYRMRVRAMFVCWAAIIAGLCYSVGESQHFDTLHPLLDTYSTLLDNGNLHLISFQP